MVEIKVRGVKAYKSRGKLYFYHRKTRLRIRAEFGTAAFLAEVERLDQSRLPEAVPVRVGTLGALIAAYRASPEFRQLAVRTRDDYQKVFNYLRPLDGDPLVNIDPAYTLAVRNAAFDKRKRHFANSVVTVLRLLFAWGQLYGVGVDKNAAIVPKFRRPRGTPKANRRGTREELEIVLDAAPVELRLAIALAVCTGMRESDVLRFPWSGYVDGTIHGRAAKTGAPISMPAHPMLRELLHQAPRLGPIIVVGARGNAFTPSGFRTRFFKLIRQLRTAGQVAPGLTFHGLRTTTATMLAEAGCDTQTIMAITGHETEAMVKLYREEADKKGRADVAIKKLDFAVRRNGKRTQ
jgi:integrase